MDPYATHLPHLIRAVLIAGGPVLELGTGDYSTPILREICRHQKRALTSFENDPVWFGKFNDLPLDSFLSIHKVAPDWSDLHLDLDYSVIFLDLHPPEFRKPVLERIWKRGDIIVAHDSEVLAFDWAQCKYHHEFTSPEGPKTMVAGNTLDVVK